MKKSLVDFIKRFPLLEKALRLILGRRNTPPYEKAIVGKDNILNLGEAYFHNCKFDIVGDGNELDIMNSASFKNVTFYIRGNHNKIQISDNVRFNRGGLLWIEDDNCEIAIARNATFEDIHIAVTEPHSKVTIGEDCMFANDIDIRTGDSHSIIDTQTNSRINYAQNITIDNHVWVAAHVSILKGVTLLSNSIVATRSVVTKKFDTGNILIGGSPAKVLKENITWDRKRILKTETV